MKEDAFKGLMRDFYTSYAGRRATTADFQRMAEQRIGVPLDWFFDEWVGKTAVPTYTVSWRKEAVEGGRWRVRLRVRQSGVPDSFRMHESDSGHFSWWDYRGAGFRRNLGLRIDHILLSEPLAERCAAASIDRAPRAWERPSDHAPVLVELS